MDEQSKYTEQELQELLPSRADRLGYGVLRRMVKRFHGVKTDYIPKGDLYVHVHPLLEVDVRCLAQFLPASRFTPIETLKYEAHFLGRDAEPFIYFSNPKLQAIEIDDKTWYPVIGYNPNLPYIAPVIVHVPAKELD